MSRRCCTVDLLVGGPREARLRHRQRRRSSTRSHRDVGHGRDDAVAVAARVQKAEEVVVVEEGEMEEGGRDDYGHRARYTARPALARGDRGVRHSGGFGVDLSDGGSRRRRHRGHHALQMMRPTEALLRHPRQTTSPACRCADVAWQSQAVQTAAEQTVSRVRPAGSAARHPCSATRC